jgi:Restriction endonuclease
MSYFSTYADAPVDDVKDAPQKTLDPGGDVLPFGHLDDRRFEILVYRLKCAELHGSGCRVALMTGVAERGRDVIVYSPTGKVRQIVQCKHHKDRVSAPEVRRELLKLALHHHLDPSILGAGDVEYELWCPGGLSEPAGRFFDSWPTDWEHVAMDADARSVIDTHAHLNAIDWTTVGERVASARVRPSWWPGAVEPPSRG